MTSPLHLTLVLAVALTGCAGARSQTVATARPIAAAPVVIAPSHAQVSEVAEVAEVAEVEEARGRVVVVETEVEVFDGIDFDGDTAAIAPSSHRMLEAIASTLAGNPSIVLLQVRGHIDARGDRVTRAELARARAEAVVADLVKLGVAPERLEAYGASDSEPIAPRGDPRNARIELIILDRDSD